MTFRIYVAAPYGDAPLVRGVHALLRSLGLEPTSTWAEESDDCAEELAAMSIRVVRRLAQRNDDDLASSEAVLVLPREGAGREMYAEARLAIAFRIPVVWVGTPVCLTAFREGVSRVPSLQDALDTVQRMARDRAAA